jgi:hypothetical protein
LGISKTASTDSNSSLQMKFFQKFENCWTKSELTLWKWFSESEWINFLVSNERFFFQCHGWSLVIMKEIVWAPLQRVWAKQERGMRNFDLNSLKL